MALASPEAGVDVVLDGWGLRAGQDMPVSMERVVGDPLITNVLLLLDANYVRKADARHEGVLRHNCLPSASTATRSKRGWYLCSSTRGRDRLACRII